MSEHVRYLISEGGSDNRASWMSAGQSVLVPAQAQLSDTSTFEQVVFVVPKNNPYNYYGAQNASPLASSSAINNLWSAWIMFNADYTTVAGAGLTLRLYRAGALIGSGAAADIAGWQSSEAAETGGIPTIAKYTPTQLPWLTTFAPATGQGLQAPANQTLSSTVAFLPLQPNDVLTLLYNNNSDGNWTPPTFNFMVDLT